MKKFEVSDKLSLYEEFNRGEENVYTLSHEYGDNVSFSETEMIKLVEIFKQHLFNKDMKEVVNEPKA